MDRALNLGCGDKFPPEFDFNWFCVDKHDFSEVFAEHPELHFTQHDLKDTLRYPDNHFTFVWCHHVLEHLPARHPTKDIDFVVYVVNEIRRVLRPGGQAHIIVPWQEHPNATRAPTHYRLFHETVFQWFSSPNEKMKGEHAASQLSQGWQVQRSNTQDDCHVYGILIKKA